MADFNAREILNIVLGVVFIVLGVAISNITNGMGTYVVNQFAQAINTTPSSIEILSNSSISGILGAALTMSGVALLGFAIGRMIYHMVSGVSEAANTAP